MCSLDKYKHTLLLLLLPTMLVTYSVRAVAQDEELLVDPTLPLSLQFVENSASGFDFETGVSAASGLLSGLFTSYELSSVLIRGDNRIAVINGERVREGGSIGNATVISIEPDNVTLNVDGEIEKLELYENSIKTLVEGEN